MQGKSLYRTATFNAHSLTHTHFKSQLQFIHRGTAAVNCTLYQTGHQRNDATGVGQTHETKLIHQTEQATTSITDKVLG
jgi:hypothetical protein